MQVMLFGGDERLVIKVLGCLGGHLLGRKSAAPGKSTQAKKAVEAKQSQKQRDRRKADGVKVTKPDCLRPGCSTPSTLGGLCYRHMPKCAIHRCQNKPLEGGRCTKHTKDDGIKVTTASAPAAARANEAQA